MNTIKKKEEIYSKELNLNNEQKILKERHQSIRKGQILSLLKRYPLPSGALILFLISAFSWLIGQNVIAHWSLIGILVWGGIPLIWDAAKRLLRREIGIDIIALIAIIGSLWLREYLAGAIIVLMLSGGEALEAYALRRAKRSLSSLIERAPHVAHVWREKQLIDIPVEAIHIGMITIVKPGELIPVDGVVVEGTSDVSEADLTGEPVPVRKTAGMIVLSGSVNLDGVLEVRASASSAESQYAQIIRLVQEAQEQKAPIHRLADRYSLVFTTATLLLATLAWLLSGQSINALAVLVVATPCPLILATPIAIMSGINIAAREGIIVKSGSAIEQLGEVDTVVFDKTGTLTLGAPEVTEVLLTKQGDPEAPSYTEDEVLRFAASIEQLSTHILARAVVQAAQKQRLPVSPAHDCQEIFGKGICGDIDYDGSVNEQQGRATINVTVGNRTFFRLMDIPLPSDLLEERERRRAAGQICSFIALNKRVVGLIVLEDVPRPEIAHLCPALKAEGIKQTILLTGDAEIVAQQIGKIAGIDHIIARCLPEDKVQVVKDQEKQGSKVLMVGDGINDAPALASATVGMALGSQGLTAASNAADTILLSNNIMRVVTAIALGHRVLHIARQGIWIGIGLSSIAMVFAAAGYIPPAVGALLQEGIEIIVIFNALRVGATSVHNRLSFTPLAVR